MTPSEGAAWFFDAGAESLDFAYTGALADERLHSPEDLAGWLAEHLAHPAPEVGERDLADALILREALARLHLAAADHTPFAPDDIDTLNLFAATPDIPPALAGGRRQAGAGRIRRCAADDCRLVFRDESRTNSRRWCSMQRCGNRAKVRAHRERERAARS